MLHLYVTLLSVSIYLLDANVTPLYDRMLRAKGFDLIDDTL